MNAQCLSLATTKHYRCLTEINDRLESLKASADENTKDHENHEVFKYEQDEQLQLWKQRYS